MRFTSSQTGGIKLPTLYLPGTTIKLTKETSTAISQLDIFFNVAGGMSLSQVSQITGLPSSTIQNWVKRGWVPNPKDKRYNTASFSRILIINVLRNCIQLEKISQLMQYINGDVNNQDDDIITDRELYKFLCTAIINIENWPNFTYDHVSEYTNEILKDYSGPFEDSAERLQKGLTIMLLSYMSSIIKNHVDEMLNSIS